MHDFVKLWQFDLADRRHVLIDTNKKALLDAKGRDGVRVMPLLGMLARTSA